MGFLDGAQFTAPRLNTVSPSLEHFLGYKKSEDERQQRFQQDMAQFQSNLKLQELDKGMQMQRRNEMINRPKDVVVAPGAIVSPLDNAKLEIQKDRNRILDSKTAIQDQNTDDRTAILQQNANTNAIKATNPNHVQVRTQGGNVVTMDKRTGEIVDTGIAQGTLTGDQQFENKQTLQTQAENARGTLETQKQGNRVVNLNTRGAQNNSNIQERGRQDRLTKQTDTPYNPTNLPTQQKTAEQLKANQFIQSNPELGKFVTIDPNTGLVNITQPSTRTSLFGGSSGPTVDQYHQIMAGIHGQTPSYKSRPEEPPVVNQPATADIYVTKDGRRFKLNNPSQLAAALQQGYVQVK